MSDDEKDDRKPKYRDLNFSGLGDHSKRGKKLVPPLKKIDKLTHLSWRDDFAPEMLWAFLLTAVLPREEYLECFRAVVNWYGETVHRPDETREGQNAARVMADAGRAGGDEPPRSPLEHTSLAGLSDQHFAQFLAIPLKHPLGYAALRPLLLIDALPGGPRWRETLGVEPSESDWRTLAEAVVGFLDHQSEKSTDVRWLKLVSMMAAGRIFFPQSMREQVEHVVAYPNQGDLRSVRPFIRSSEMAFRTVVPERWVDSFWAETLRKTGCMDPSSEDDYFKQHPPRLTRRTILDLRSQLADRFRAVNTTTRTDARLDSCFGFALYAASLLEEIAAPPLSRMLVGQFALRSLVEAVINFGFLLAKDDPALWLAYRVHGSGQAKLAFLKLEESAGELPPFVDQEVLHAIANEDSWQEFLDIELGHWANKNARDLAIEGGVKDVYDKYYGWTSSFLHAQWGSVRDSNFVTCANSLHRLHRIPRPFHRLLPTVVPDAIALVNRILTLLESAYPAMEKLGRIAEIAPPVSPPAPTAPEAADADPK